MPSSEESTGDLDALEQALHASPDDVGLLTRLAEAYCRAGRMLPALQTYDRLIDLGAADAAVWRGTGNALTDVGEYAQAIGAYEQALKLDDDDAEARHNLARVLYRLGDADRAVDHLRQLARQHDRLETWVGLATILPGCPQATHADVLEVRQTLGRILGKLGTARERPKVHRSRSRFRVGYLSAYFGGANYMKPVWSTLNHHDRTRFEIHLFADKVGRNDLNWFQGGTHDRIHRITELNNDELAALIRQQEIEILVDLNAYSTPERLELFRAPFAPVTVAWFNMYATSGLPAVDVLIGDAEVIRTEEERFYTETIERLPVSYLTFNVNHPVPDVVDSPMLHNGFLTFGSLVTQYKITPPVLDAWSQILNQTENSRLVLANTELKSAQNREYVLKQFRERGTDTNRIMLLGPADHWSFLKYYDRIDVALDAFPYNGGTTTMEAIWQGVPVLTFDGDRWASRTSQTLLRRCHLGDFVAPDATGYVDQAVALAQDPQTPDQLAELRRAMRTSLSKSSACDTRRLARELENIYERIWTSR